MPTYSYACTECGNRFDAVQAFSDAALTTCTECNGRLRSCSGNRHARLASSCLRNRRIHHRNSPCRPLPALFTSKTDLQNGLKQTGAGGGRSRHTRARAMLVITEVALALVLLIGAGLLIRSSLAYERSTRL